MPAPLRHPAFHETCRTFYSGSACTVTEQVKKWRASRFAKDARRAAHMNELAQLDRVVARGAIVKTDGERPRPGGKGDDGAIRIGVAAAGLEIQLILLSLRSVGEGVDRAQLLRLVRGCGASALLDGQACDCGRDWRAVADNLEPEGNGRAQPEAVYLTDLVGI